LTVGPSMSEVFQDVEQAATVAPSFDAPNPLRGLREQAGMPLSALAVMLKVPPQKLEALEDGRYADLPNLTFARALATSVCRVLKVDPTPVLSALPQSQSVHIRQSDEGLNTPFPASGGAVSGISLGLLTPVLKRPAFWMLLVLLSAVLMWFLLPANLADLSMSTAVPGATQTEPTVPVEPEPEPVLAPEVSPPLVAPDSQSVAAVEAAPATPIPEVAPAVAAPVQVEAASAPQETPVLKLRVREASWVQVTGSGGRLLLQRTLQPGEDVSFGADLPLSVVLGRADAAEVQVRGAAFDVTPYVRNRVARFEVK